MAEPQSRTKQAKFFTNLTFRMTTNAKKKFESLAVGGPLFWATPISCILAELLNFETLFRKTAETFLIHQNVRNRRIYIGVMKQHIGQNAYFSRKSRKAIF